MAALTLFATAYFFHFHEKLPNPNETSRLYVTLAVVNDGTLSIDGPFAKYGPVWDRSVVNGKSYGDKAPGVSFIGVPFYAVAKWTAAIFGAELSLRAAHFVVRTPFLVLNALFVAYLFLFLRPYCEAVRLRFAVVMTYALGTIAFTYAPLLFGHQHAAVFLFSGFALMEERRRARGPVSGRRALLAGFLLGAAFAVEYPALFLVAIVGLYALVAVRPWKSIAFVALGGLIPIALTLYYNSQAFGSPFSTGYTHHGSAYFGQIHAQGLFGITTPKLNALYGAFLSLHRGLFVLSPALAFAIPGFFLLGRQREHRAALVCSIAVVLMYVYFVSSLIYWTGGDTTGPRHFAPAIPFMLPALAVFANAVARSRWRWPEYWFVGFALASIAIVQFQSIPFPFPEPRIVNPFRDFTLDFWRDGLVPANPGMWFGLEGITSTVPYLLVLAWIARRVSLASPTSMIRVASAVLAVVALYAVTTAKPEATDDLSRGESARYRKDYTPRPSAPSSPSPGPVRER